MKKKPNWKLMSPKDKTKYRAKHPVVRKPKAGRKRSKKPLVGGLTIRESKALVKKARIPRSEWVRPEKPNQEKQRIAL